MDLTPLIFTVAGIIIVGIYSLIAVQPAELGSYFSKKFSSYLYEKPKSGFWSLYDKITEQRRVILFSLYLLVVSTAVVDLILWQQNAATAESNQNSILITSVLILILLYGLLKFYFYGQVKIRETPHGLKAKAENILQNLSITAGIDTPALVVLAHNNPTTFSAKKNRGQTIIYITSSLLNLCTEQELQAVLAREIANHEMRRNSFLRQTNNLILLFELLSFAWLFLFLYSINSDLPFILIFIIFVSYLRLSQLGYGYLFGGSYALAGEALARLVNPPLALAVFLSYLIRYSLAWRETVTADLKAIDYTRYPVALYSILLKIANYHQPEDLLPEEFSGLYLTGEQTVTADKPMLEASIDERLEILNEIDSSVSDSALLKKPRLTCPGCQTNLLKQDFIFDEIDKPYYVCQKLQHAWFDAGLLYQISAPILFAKVDSASPLMQPAIPGAISGGNCPLCLIPLVHQYDPFISKNIWIWHCDSCQGDLISLADFQQYILFRAEKEKLQKNK